MTMPPLTTFAEPLEVTQADNAARAQAFAERAEALLLEVKAAGSAPEARRLATKCAVEAASARHFGWEGGVEGWAWARLARAAADAACEVAVEMTARNLPRLPKEE